MKNFDYVLARTAAEASAAAAAGAVFKGGGTELLDRMKEGVTTPKTVVNLLTVRGMNEIKVGDDRITLGATATLDALASHADLRARAPGVSESAGETATPLVRNRATLGGNLCQRPRCWYFRNETYACLKKGGQQCYALTGENKYHAIFGNMNCAAIHASNLATIFWALDATIHVSDAGKTTEMKFEDFLVAPEKDITREHVLSGGQLIESVSFDAKSARGSAYYEINEKESFDWALSSAAVRLTMDGDKVADARVVVSAVAPVPLRLIGVEALLKGKSLSAATLEAASEKAAEGASPLRDNAYKVQLMKVSLRRALKLAESRARSPR